MRFALKVAGDEPEVENGSSVILSTVHSMCNFLNSLRSGKANMATKVVYNCVALAERNS